MRGQFAQQAAHDFAAARFGQCFSKADVVWPGEGADLFRDPLAQLVLQCFAGLVAAFKGYKSGDGLSFQFVGTANNGGLGNLGMRDQR